MDELVVSRHRKAGIALLGGVIADLVQREVGRHLLEIGPFWLAAILVHALIDTYERVLGEIPGILPRKAEADDERDGAVGVVLEQLLERRDVVSHDKGRLLCGNSLIR